MNYSTEYPLAIQFCYAFKKNTLLNQFFYMEGGNVLISNRIINTFQNKATQTLVFYGK